MPQLSLFDSDDEPQPAAKKPRRRSDTRQKPVTAGEASVTGPANEPVAEGLFRAEFFHAEEPISPPILPETAAVETQEADDGDKPASLDPTQWTLRPDFGDFVNRATGEVREADDLPFASREVATIAVCEVWDESQDLGDDWP